MTFSDKGIVCADCSEEFMFSAAEQELFATRGFTNEPKRCLPCRQKRRSDRGESMPQRQMFPAVCARCETETEVPFEPRDGRPVYCRECYNQMRQ